MRIYIKQTESSRNTNVCSVCGCTTEDECQVVGDCGGGWGSSRWGERKRKRENKGEGVKILDLPLPREKHCWRFYCLSWQAQDWACYCVCVCVCLCVCAHMCLLLDHSHWHGETLYVILDSGFSLLIKLACFPFSIKMLRCVSQWKAQGEHLEN